MKKFKFIAFFIAVMTTMPILQSCLDDDSSSDSLVIGTINLISPVARISISLWMMEKQCSRAMETDGSVTRIKTGNAPL